MSAVAIAIGGAAVVGGLVAYSGQQAAKQSADQQVSAANNATNAQLQMFNQQQQNEQPWLNAGSSALSQLQSKLPSLSQQFTSADMTADDGYQFRLQQGQQAINNSASARGLVNSGATMKALSDYNQGAASQEYQNAYNRFTQNQNQQFNQLASIAGLGQTANSALGQDSSSTSNSIGNNITSAGAAQAAGTIGQANAISSGLGSLTNAGNTWMGYNMMNRGNTGGNYGQTMNSLNSNDASLDSSMAGFQMPQGLG